MEFEFTYRFEIIYQSKNLKDVSDFMSKLDLGTGEIGIYETITFQYTKEEKPISYFKELIKKAYEELGCVVLKIKGGKIE